MTKFESDVKMIPFPQAAVYGKLADLNNLKGIEDRLPKDKLKSFSFDAESMTFEVEPVGQITLKIVEKEPCSCIKFGTVVSPLPFNVWIQLLPVGETQCKMKVTIGLELNPFMKAMVQKPLQEGVCKLADTLALIQY